MGRSLRALDRVLRDRCGVPAESIRLIDNCVEPQDLARAIDNAAREAESVFILYFIGHGLIGTDRKLHLATYSSMSSTPRGAYAALPYSEIRLILEECRARSVVVILDSCRSGRVSDWNLRTDVLDSPVAYGGFLLSAAAADEEALAPADAEYTLFTGEVIRFLNEGDPSAGHTFLCLDDLYEYLDRRLPTANRPHRRVQGRVGDLELAPNPAYVMRQPPTPAAVDSVSGDSVAPYRGLAFYGPADARWFVGRKYVTERLVSRIADHDATHGPIMVVGPSGVGKSSLVRAGVVPALRDNAFPRSSTWPIMIMTPGREPVARLSESLGEALAEHPRTIHRRLRDNPTAISEMIEQILCDTARDILVDGRLLLVVDQMEQTFTLCDDNDERRTFVDALCAAASPGSRAVVCAVLRADFFGHCASHPGLLQALEVQGGQVFVGPMNGGQLRSVIIEPALLANLRVDPELPEEILRDLAVGDDSDLIDGGALPLVSHALDAAWQLRSGNVITAHGYERVGGIRGSIAHTANSAFLDFDSDEQEACRRLMVRMVTVGTDAPDTHRPIDLSDLRGIHDCAEKVASVLIRARLLVRDETSVRLTHDAVVRHWDRLRAWISDDRSWHIVRQQISEAHLIWRDRRRDDNLLTGDRLADAVRWTADPPRAALLTTDESAFVAASARQRQRRIRRLQQVIAILCVLVLATATSALYAMAKSAESRRAADVAVARSLVDSARLEFFGRPDLAILRVAAALRLTDDIDIRVAAGPIIQSSAGMSATLSMPSGFSVNPEKATLTPIPGTTQVVVDDGAYDDSPKFWLVDLATRAIDEVTLPLGGPGSDIALIDSSRKTAISTDTDILIVDESDPSNPILEIPVDARPFGVVGIPNGSIVAWCDSANRLSVIDARWETEPTILPDSCSPTSVQFLHSTRTPRNHVALSADGAIVVGLSEEILTIHNVATSDRTVVNAGGGIVMDFDLSPDGNFVATLDNDGIAKIWDLRAVPLVPTEVSDPGAQVRALAFSTDSRNLTVGTDSNIRHWRVHQNTWADDPSLDRPATAVEYVSDGSSLLTIDKQGQLIQWDGTILPNYDDYADLPIAVSADGTYVATIGIKHDEGFGLSLRKWDIRRNPPVAHVFAPSVWYTQTPTAAISDDGELVAVSRGWEAGVEIWSTGADARIIARVHAPGSLVDRMEFSPDGKVLAYIVVESDNSSELKFFSVDEHRELISEEKFEFVQSIRRIPSGHLLIDSRIPQDRSDGNQEFESVVFDMDSMSSMGGPARAVGYAVAVSPDGGRTVRDNNGGAIVWDEETGTTIAELADPPYAVAIIPNTRFAFSRDGSNLIAYNGVSVGSADPGDVPAGFDYELAVWDTSTGRFAGGLNANGIPIATGDGRLFFFPVDIDNQPQVFETALWSTDRQVLTDRLCAVVGRDLTPEEWQSTATLRDREYTSTCPSNTS
nr:NACHT and WD repeat domain-containing protein [Nocardia mangyaensis]